MLCPVVPHGAWVEKESVRSLWRWTDDVTANITGSHSYGDKSPGTFKHNLRLFLTETFGPKLDISSFVSTSNSGEMPNSL